MTIDFMVKIIVSDFYLTELRLLYVLKTRAATAEVMSLEKDEVRSCRAAPLLLGSSRALGKPSPVLLPYSQQIEGVCDLSRITPCIVAKRGIDLKSPSSQTVPSPLAEVFLHGKRSFLLAVLLVVSGHVLW